MAPDEFRAVSSVQIGRVAHQCTPPVIVSQGLEFRDIHLTNPLSFPSIRESSHEITNTSSTQFRRLWQWLDHPGRIHAARMWCRHGWSVSIVGWDKYWIIQRKWRRSRSGARLVQQRTRRWSQRIELEQWARRRGRQRNRWFFRTIQFQFQCELQQRIGHA